jgi:TRAP-type uncharacterized transport system fused permease subunit
MLMGVILGAIVLEATRRVIGWALPITAIVFMVYGFAFAGSSRCACSTSST